MHHNLPAACSRGVLWQRWPHPAGVAQVAAEHRQPQDERHGEERGLHGLAGGPAGGVHACSPAPQPSSHPLLPQSRTEAPARPPVQQVRSGAFTADGTELLTSGGDGQVYVWDLRTQRCRQRYVDEGCLNGTSLACSPDGGLFATGGRGGWERCFVLGGCLSGVGGSPLSAGCWHGLRSAEPERPAALPRLLPAWRATPPPGPAPTLQAPAAAL